MEQLSRIGASFALCIIANCWVGRAHAAGEVALAETLYQAARDLMAEGKHAEACPKFAESYRLDPATGTLLNLAACHEAQGKLASAWIEYKDAAVAASRDGREDRVRYADERVRELEPKLSRLTIVLAAGVDQKSLEVFIDGARVGSAALGVPVPLDPGEHVIEAKAPGRLSFSQTLTIAAEADQQTLTLEELELDPSAAAPTPAPTQPSAPPPTYQQPPPAPAPPLGPVGAEPTTPTSVYVAGGATAALAVGAIVSGMLYSKYHNNYESSRAKDDYHSAQVFGYINAGSTAAAIGGAMLTGYLYFSRDDSQTTVTGARVAPLLGRSVLGVSAGGAF